MKFFVINLKSAVERRKYISNLCEKYGADYEIVEAVVGKELSEKFLNAICDPQVVSKIFGKPLKKGEIGCALSHRACLERMLALGLDEAVIIEDDASFDERLFEFLRLKERFPPELELLLLGHYRQVYLDDGFRVESPFSLRYDFDFGEGHHLKRLVGGGLGSHGYYVRKAGAKKLLDATRRLLKPYDHYTSSDEVSNVYALYPVLIETDEMMGLKSSIQNNENRQKKRFKLKKYFKRFRKWAMFFVPSLMKLKEYR